MRIFILIGLLMGFSLSASATKQTQSQEILIGEGDRTKSLADYKPRRPCPRDDPYCEWVV